MQQPIYGTWIFSHIGFNRKKSDLTRYLSSKGSTLDWTLFTTQDAIPLKSQTSTTRFTFKNIWSSIHIRQEYYFISEHIIVI
jgi:predicted ATP-grasp superfamily ATP-dependent carboligase